MSELPLYLSVAAQHARSTRFHAEKTECVRAGERVCVCECVSV